MTGKDETLSTLKFAQSVKQVQTKAPWVHDSAWHTSDWIFRQRQVFVCVYVHSGYRFETCQ